jgi:hypothetical protein
MIYSKNLILFHLLSGGLAQKPGGRVYSYSKNSWFWDKNHDFYSRAENLE